jgi:hypothetical protein
MATKCGLDDMPNLKVVVVILNLNNHLEGFLVLKTETGELDVQGKIMPVYKQAEKLFRKALDGLSTPQSGKGHLKVVFEFIGGFSEGGVLGDTAMWRQVYTHGMVKREAPFDSAQSVMAHMNSLLKDEGGEGFQQFFAALSERARQDRNEGSSIPTLVCAYQYKLVNAQDVQGRFFELVDQDGALGTVNVPTRGFFQSMVQVLPDLEALVIELNNLDGALIKQPFLQSLEELYWLRNRFQEPFEEEYRASGARYELRFSYVGSFPVDQAHVNEGPGIDNGPHFKPWLARMHMILVPHPNPRLEQA